MKLNLMNISSQLVLGESVTVKTSELNETLSKVEHLVRSCYQDQYKDYIENNEEYNFESFAHSYFNRSVDCELNIEDDYCKISPI